MAAPLLSTVTLFTELGVTACVLFLFHDAYRKGVFHRKLALGVLVYEVLFNISYMAYRAVTHPVGEAHSGWVIALAAGHGILSLVMFVALVAFLLYAWKGFGKGRNVFRERRVLMLVFLFWWLLAVGSGIAFYAAEYL